MTDTPLIHVVDDDESLLSSLAEILEAEGWEVAPHMSSEDFLASAPPLREGCIVLDLRMSGISGLELQTVLTDQNIPLPIIFLSGHGRIRSAVQAVRAGAIDFLEKPVDNDVLIQRVREAIDKSCHLVARETALSKLTIREREIVALLCQGKPNKTVAAELDISEKTVEFHRANIMAKLGASSVSAIHAMIRRPQRSST